MEALALLLIVALIVIVVGAILGIIAYNAARKNAIEIQRLHTILSKTKDDLHILQKRHDILHKTLSSSNIPSHNFLEKTQTNLQTTQDVLHTKPMVQNFTNAVSPISSPFPTEPTLAESSTQIAKVSNKTVAHTPPAKTYNSAPISNKAEKQKLLDKDTQHYPAYKKSKAAHSALFDFKFEQIFTQKVMVLIAGIFFIFAAFFLVRYSIENAIMTPLARITLSFIFGLVLIGASFVCAIFAHNNQDSYAIDSTAESKTKLSPVSANTKSFLAQLFSHTNAKTLSIIAQTCIGSGLVVEFFSFYGGYRLYGFFGFFGTFAGLCSIACLALALALRFGLVIGVFGVLGGFSTPLLLASSTYNIPLLFAYLCAFYMLVLYMSYKIKSIWLMGAASLFVLLYALVSYNQHNNALSVWIVFFAVWLVLCSHIVLLAALYPTESIPNSYGLNSNITLANSKTMLRHPYWALRASFLGASILGFVVFWGLSCSLYVLELQSLELGFFCVLCVLVLLLPRLRSFAYFRVEEKLLSVPIIFALLLVVAVFLNTTNITNTIWCGFMGLFLVGIALNAYLSSQKVWYLWIFWLCAMLFGILGKDITSFIAIAMCVGIYGFVAHYKLSLRNDTLLVLCVVGAFVLISKAYAYVGTFISLPSGFGGSALWLLSGVLLVVLGHTRVAPRAIKGMEWIFIICGVIVLFVAISQNLIDFNTIFALRISTHNTIALSTYFLVSVANLILFAKFLRYRAHQKTESSAHAAPQTLDSASKAMFGLGSLSAVLLIAVVHNVCANIVMLCMGECQPPFFECETGIIRSYWFSISAIALLCLALVAVRGWRIVARLIWQRGANKNLYNIIKQAGIALSIIFSIQAVLDMSRVVVKMGKYVYEPDFFNGVFLLLSVFGAMAALFALSLIMQRLWHYDILPYTSFKRLYCVGLDIVVFIFGLVWIFYALHLGIWYIEFWHYNDEYVGYIHSLLLVLLGIGCLIGFLKTSIRSLRIYSLALFIIVTLKVFFVDTIGFSGLVKVGLFVVMGALFLAISLLYTKYVFKK